MTATNSLLIQIQRDIEGPPVKLPHAYNKARHVVGPPETNLELRRTTTISTPYSLFSNTVRRVERKPSPIGTVPTTSYR